MRTKRAIESAFGLFTLSILSVLSIILAALIIQGTAYAGEPTPGLRPSHVSPDDAVAEALEECETHPSVTAAGTPLEVCMDSYGYVRKGDSWVKKPAHR